MKTLPLAFLTLLFCLVLGAQSIHAQCSPGYAYMTSLTWQSGNQVFGYSSTELDYCAGLYYDPAVWGRFTEGNWATENPFLLGQGYTEGYADVTPAEVYFSYAYPLNNEYSMSIRSIILSNITKSMFAIGAVTIIGMIRGSLDLRVK